eukprot:COSAG01_NODE_132_length_24759_cov_13.862298_3_plen_39_part_00
MREQCRDPAQARGMGVVPQYQVRHDTSGCVRGRLPACH